MSRRSNSVQRNQHLIHSGGKELLAPTIDYVLVDASGSMIWGGGNKWDTCMAALDTYLGDCKAVNLNSQLIVQVFEGHDHDDVQRDHRLEHFVPFSEDKLHAGGGGTPLYQAINAMGLRLRELMPERCSIVIVTDGDADDDKNSDAARHARAVLDWMRAQGWAVTFIGCEFDNTEQAGVLGAEPQHFIGVQRGQMRSAAKALADKRKRYQNGADIEFSDEEKEKFGGYLANPNKG